MPDEDPEILDLTFIEDEVRRVEISDDMAMVWDGQANGGVHWRWDHLCEVYEDPIEGLVRKRIASYLSKGHEIVVESPLTIEGSLLCGACKTHGFVREGRWVDA